jgi:hypothetical protein
VSGDVVRIELEVEVVDESVIGAARTADGARREFAGWLGLMTVLTALAEPGTTPAATPRAPPAARAET